MKNKAKYIDTEVFYNLWHLGYNQWSKITIFPEMCLVAYLIEENQKYNNM